MKKIKELQISSLDLSMPNKYQPAWYKLGLSPIKVNMPAKQKGIRPIIIKNDDVDPLDQFEDVDSLQQIKQAQFMASPNESNWFDDAPIDPSKIIDNNDVVNIDGLQRFEIKSKVPIKFNGPIKTANTAEPIDTTTNAADDNDDLISIRNKLINKRKMQEELEQKQKQQKENADLLKPGEFVVMFKGKKLDTPGDLNKTKAICEHVILNTEDIQDDDLVVFMRVPLNKIFK